MHSPPRPIPRGSPTRAAGAGSPSRRVARGRTRRRRPRACRRVGVRAADRDRRCSSLVSFHVLAVQHAFAIDRLTEQKHDRGAAVRALTGRGRDAVVAAAIVDAAKRMGMQAPQTVDYIDACRQLLRATPRRIARRARWPTSTARRRRALTPSHRPPPRRPAGATTRPPRPPRPLPPLAPRAARSNRRCTAASEARPTAARRAPAAPARLLHRARRGRVRTAVARASPNFRC